MKSSEPPNLPVGWRFRPTDFELLDHYLKSKRLGLPIDYFHIEEIQLYNFNPRDLPDSPDNERYFFCRHETYLENGRTKRKRKARDGFWKCTGQTVSLAAEDSKEKIGTRKILVYHDPYPTKWVIHEYEYTAKLNLPVEGDFVLCKLKNQGNKKSKKVEPYPNQNKTINGSNKVESSSTKAKTKNTKPKKKARKDLSICNAVSAAAIGNQNVGEGEQCNHMSSDFRTQNPNDKATMPPYKKAESDYQNLSDFEYQNFSHLEHHQDVSYPQFTPSISNPQFTPNISNPQNSSHFEEHQHVSYPQLNPNISNRQNSSHFEEHQHVSYPQLSPNISNPRFTRRISNPGNSSHLERHHDVSPQLSPNISNPQFTPNISNLQKSSHFESHQNVSDPQFNPTISNLQFSPNISSPQFSQDIYNDLGINSLSESQTPTEMTYDSSCQKNKPNYLVNLDSEHQNTSNDTYSSPFEQCQWSPLSKMPPNFENQNQYEKISDSIHEYNWGALMNNDIQETTFQDLESRHEKTDMTVLEDYQDSFSEQTLAELMACYELNVNLSSPPE